MTNNDIYDNVLFIIKQNALFDVNIHPYTRAKPFKTFEVLRDSLYYSITLNT